LLESRLFEDVERDAEKIRVVIDEEQEAGFIDRFVRGELKDRFVKEHKGMQDMVGVIKKSVEGMLKGEAGEEEWTRDVLALVGVDG
jgi:hypothetical protein